MVLRSRIGGSRVVDMISGEQLPRITAENSPQRRRERRGEPVTRFLDCPRTNHHSLLRQSSFDPPA